MARDSDAGEAVLVIAAMMPYIIWSVFTAYLRMKKTASRSADVFYGTMVKNGMPRREARQLADEYASTFTIRSIIQTATSRRG